MNSKQKTVAVLGNGVVGVAVAKGFAELGYRVIFGTRDVSGGKTRDALQAVPGATAASFAEAAKAADLAFIALPWNGLRAGLELAGAQNLAGKIVIDATNPLDLSSGTPRSALGTDDSAGEIVQRMLPEARVVKALNIITSSHMVHPKLPDGTPDMIIAGNDAAAKAAVDAILQGFGWRQAIDLGDITACRLIEPFALVWISYAFKNNHWTHAFSLLNQKAA